MQTGRRRGHRSARLSVYGLVALTVRCPVVAVDVGRKWHVSDALDAGKKSGTGAKRMRRSPKLPRSVTSASSSAGSAHRAQSRVSPRSRSSARAAPGTPTHSAILRHLACQQNFDPPAEKILCRRIVRAQGLGTLSAAAAVEPGREHPRIVHDQQSSGRSKSGNSRNFDPANLTLPAPLPIRRLADAGAAGAIPSGPAMAPGQCVRAADHSGSPRRASRRL